MDIRVSFKARLASICWSRNGVFDPIKQVIFDRKKNMDDFWLRHIIKFTKDFHETVLSVVSLKPSCINIREEWKALHTTLSQKGSCR